MNKSISKTIILFLFSILITNYTFAQNVEETEKKAETAFNSLNLKKAIELLRKANELAPNTSRIQEKLANALFISDNNSKEAFDIYSGLFNSNSASPQANLRYAKLLSSRNNFKEAADVYNRVFPKSNYDLNYFLNLANPNTSISVKNTLDLNTNLSDFSPMFYKNGIAYISVRKKRDNAGWNMKNNIYEYYTDAFYSEKNENGSFQVSNKLLNLKDATYMEGPMSFTNEYGVMYITRSNALNNTINKSSDKKTVNLKIYRINYKGDLNNWSEATEVVLNNAENASDFSYAHPAFTPDNNTLIFASNMPGGFGGTDLWKVRVNGNEFSTPENLGPEINTPGEEKFPYVAKDGTLYYATDGLPGLGGLDVFKSVQNSGFYSTPVNMGSPINSRNDDFGFIIDKDNKAGYFSSNRTNTGLGDDDIYSWVSSEMNLTVIVVDKATNERIPNSKIKISCAENKTFTTDDNATVVVPFKPSNVCNVESLNNDFLPYTLNLKNLNASRIVTLPLERLRNDCIKMEVLVLDKTTNQPINDANLIINQQVQSIKSNGNTNDAGTYYMNCVTSNDFYQVTASKMNEDGSKYIAKTEGLSTKGKGPNDKLKMVIYIEKGEIGKNYKIDNIYYDLNKFNIRKDAALELDKIVSMLYDNPTMEIELGSHTDCRSAFKYNMDLSDKRAKAASQYIVSKGVNSTRITGKGYGESVLTNGCECEGTVKSTCTELQHQENRRTEFKILKF